MQPLALHTTEAGDAHVGELLVSHATGIGLTAADL